MLVADADRITCALPEMLTRRPPVLTNVTPAMQGVHVNVAPPLTASEPWFRKQPSGAISEPRGTGIHPEQHATGRFQIALGERDVLTRRHHVAQAAGESTGFRQ